MSCSSRRRVASAFREDEDSGASVWELQVRGGVRNLDGKAVVPLLAGS
jgi:hypothetical protein